MEYISSLLWIATWPVVIFVTYKLAFFLLKKSKQL